MLQAVAIMPGISRSGSTIAGGLMTGLEKDAAARFSFILSIPAVLGAFILSLGDVTELLSRLSSVRSSRAWWGSGPSG